MVNPVDVDVVTLFRVFGTDSYCPFLFWFLLVFRGGLVATGIFDGAGNSDVMPLVSIPTNVEDN